MSGLRSHMAGLAAEDSVARHYDLSGRAICARRWRGQSGEIDLIAREGDRVVFVEVKQSSTHDAAAAHLTEGQFRRIYNAAAEFIASEPRGQLTEVRFDLALVDAQGRVEVRENLYLH